MFAYSWSQLLLRSAAGLLTAACVSLPLHPSALNTRGVKFRIASRQAWRCFRFLMFYPVYRAWSLDLPRYEGAVTSVIRTPNIVIRQSCQNPKTPLSPQLSSPGVTLVFSCSPLGPSSDESPPLVILLCAACSGESYLDCLNHPPPPSAGSQYGFWVCQRWLLG